MLVIPLPLIFPLYPLFEATNKFQENGLVIGLNTKGNYRIVMSDHLEIIATGKKKKNHSKQSPQVPKRMTNSLDLFKLLSHLEPLAAGFPDNRFKGTHLIFFFFKP